MYLIEWESGSEKLGSWESVLNHPLFLISSVYEWQPNFGWVAC